MSKEPVIAKKGPCPEDVEEGKTYFWCSCGRSKNQPFCDGSHKGTGFEPVKWVADSTRKRAFCGCKMTSNPPFCDGTHKEL